MKVVGSLRLPKIIEARLQSHDASMLLCIAATWLCSLVLGKGMSSCRFKGHGMVLLSIGDARPDVACQSSAVLPFTFGELSSGLLALLCMSGGSGVSVRVKGIRLEAAQ